MISMIKPLSSAYIAMSPDYKSTPHTHTCSPPKLAANFPTPSLCVPCISAEGREHYTGQRCISGPLPPPSSSLIRVSSSTLITESSKEGGQRKLLLHLQEKNQKVDKKQKKMCWDLLMFYSVNQRCYLTQVPCDLYHFDDTKENQRFFPIARPLWVVMKRQCDVCAPPPFFCLLSFLLKSFLLLLCPLQPTIKPCTPAMHAPASSALITAP